MKNYSQTKKSLFKPLSVFLAVLAFTFTTNVNADGGGNADGSSTGETGYNITTGTNSTGGNCGNGPHTHAGNAICNKGGGTSVPLDGGLGILLVGAAAFGVKKLRDNKNGAI
ncbi:hypothetical protein V8G56_07490 [Gaetbulibacter aquiaggeris]|uniref:Uncharacterized protein n=1 Tax=Gaetbulibacter aquiaggeris TaxID=1735373 RepID=A0ABW7MP26_9FLAO